MQRPCPEAYLDVFPHCAVTRGGDCDGSCTNLFVRKTNQTRCRLPSQPSYYPLLLAIMLLGAGCSVVGHVLDTLTDICTLASNETARALFPLGDATREIAAARCMHYMCTLDSLLCSPLLK